MLTHYVRDRTMGPRLRLEDAVKLQTMDTASVVGLNDRGELKVGMRADINIIELDTLQLTQPVMVASLRAPLSGSESKRLFQGCLVI